MSLNESGGFGDWGAIIVLFVIAAMFGWGGNGLGGGNGVNNGYVLSSDLINRLTIQYTLFYLKYLLF